MLDWTLAELLEILDGIYRMMSKLGWTSIDEFREAMGIDSLGTIYLVRIGGRESTGTGGLYVGYWSDTEYRNTPYLKNKRIIAIVGNHDAFKNDLQEMGMIMVHELAHAWNDAYSSCLGSPSIGMAKRSGSYTDVDGNYHPGGYTASLLR